MSESANRDLVLGFVDRALNQKDLSVGDEILDGDVIFHTTGGGQVKGIDGWKGYASMFITAFPDLQFRVEDTIAEGDRVVLRWSGEGTHSGQLRDVPASGRSVKFTGIAIYRVAEGKLAELWGEIDMLGLMKQIGALS